jgi:hypothetical protein
MAGDYDVTTHVHNDTYPAISSLLNPVPLNKSVLVVGASRGIGLAIATSFAQAGASHTVFPLVFSDIFSAVLRTLDITE